MITIVLGAQGSGKTIFLCRAGYEAYKRGKDVYSNFRLNFPHKLLDFKQMMACKYNDAIILIDEAHLWGLDARSFGSKVNKNLVKQFIPQVRKQGVELYASTQRPRQIDVRLRENADIYVMCRKHIKQGNRWVSTVQSKKYPINTPVMIETDFTVLDLDKSRTFGFFANPYFRLYDTSEVITMIDEEQGQDDKKKKYKKTDKKETSIKGKDESKPKKEAET